MGNVHVRPRYKRNFLNMLNQLIFPLDSIDDGRKKINSIFFTGNTAFGYWKEFNTGTTRPSSLEITGLTISNPTLNTDFSSAGGSLFIGYGNSLGGSSGYTLVHGLFNSGTTRNSALVGYGNTAFTLDNSFIQGSYNIMRGNYISSLSSLDNVFSSDTTNNNYVNFISSSNMAITKFGSGTQRHNFLNVFSSDGNFVSAHTEYVSFVSSENCILSGTILNSLIIGSGNSIGFQYDNAFNGNQENINIIGQNIKPLQNNTGGLTYAPLSGTYINSLCFEKDFRNDIASITPLFVLPTFYDSNNSSVIKINTGGVGVQVMSYYTLSSDTLTSFALILGSTTTTDDVFLNDGGVGAFPLLPIFTGGTPYYSALTISTNVNRANVGFFVYSKNSDRFIRIKG